MKTGWRVEPKPLLLLLVFLLFAPSANAADDRQIVRVKKADCLLVVKHRPSPDVRYQSGVDVEGRAVAPADLYEPPELALPETIEIPVEVDLRRGFGLPSDDSFDADAEIGTIGFDLEEGRLTWNGKPLMADQQAALEAACREALKARDEP